MDDCTIISGLHGRQRRQERQISRDELRKARRFGMKEIDHGGAHRKYTYRGCVFIVDPSTNREITSYISNDWASPFSGTRCRSLVLMAMCAEHRTQPVLERHGRRRKRLLKHAAQHEIVIVDMSALMRTDDVDGARCRSDAVWAALALAVDQVGEDSGMMLSVIAAHSSKAEVLINHEPTDGVLYNVLIDHREFSTFRPNGEANFADALDAASKLIDKSPKNCQLQMVFVVGDQMDEPLPKLEKLVNDAGPRLVRVAGIRLGQSDMNFVSPLKAAKPRCHVLIQGCRLDVSTLASVLKECLGKDWYALPEPSRSRGQREQWTKATIRHALSWSSHANALAPLLDHRCPSCYTHVGDDPGRGWQCASCRAVFYCVDCMDRFTWHLGSAECQAKAVEYKTGYLIDGRLVSYAIALQPISSVARAAFEGHRAHFVDDNASTVGPF